MALPEGVTTCTVVAGVPVTHSGAAIKTFVTIEPSTFLVHTATGTPLVDFLEEQEIAEGVAGQFTLPHTDQTGFQDENGNAYTNWYYTARITYRTPAGTKVKAPKVKIFQLATGQTVVDLDSLPGGAPALPYTAPIATVTSVNGRTGPVTILDADLPERLSEEELSATYAPVTGSANYASPAAVTAAVAPKLDSTTAATTYAKSTPIRSTAFGGGRLWAFFGDSITNGSSSTNTAVDSYRVLVGNFVGSHKVRKSSINAGYPGENSTQLLARTDSVIAQSPESAFILIGTNDANQSVPLATFQANMTAIAAKFRAAGIPVAMGTVPPRVSSVAAGIHTLIGQYNLWLRLWAPRNGIKLADVHTSLVDPATGYFAASLANADGIHPNDAGHIAIAKAVAVVVDEMVLSEPWPVNGPQPGVGMVTNPLMAGSPATSWSINPGIGSGIAGVQGVAAASDGLPYGQWSTLRMDGTTTAGTRYLLTAATGFAIGDRLLICAYLKSTDPSGTGLTMNVLNSSTGAAVVSAPVLTLKTGSPGPVMVPITIPDPAPGASSLRVGIGQQVTVGQDITASVGAFQVYNLTALGLASLA